jgi:hypothetical protein
MALVVVLGPSGIAILSCFVLLSLFNKFFTLSFKKNIYPNFLFHGLN